jgi:hypothetical protein
VAPRATGFVDSQKELAGLPLELAQRLETHFYRPVDTKASLVLDALEAGRSDFDSYERSAWSRFIMSLLFRNPDNVRAARARLAEDMLDIDSEAERRYRRERRSHDPPTFREYMKLPESREAVDRAAMKIMADSADSKRIGEHVINMQWGTMVMPWAVPALMTSDRPVFIVNGLRHPECEILMPIGPKRIFYAVNDAELVKKALLLHPRDLVAHMNEVVVRRAVKYVYAMNHNPLAYVQANMSKSPEPTYAQRSTAVRDRRLARL